MQNVLRERMVLLAQLAQTIIFAVLIGTVFLDIGTNQAGQKKRLPVLFFVCINQGVFSALILINSCTLCVVCVVSWCVSYVCRVVCVCVSCVCRVSYVCRVLLWVVHSPF